MGGVPKPDGDDVPWRPVARCQLTFIIWGCYNGALLVLERLVPLPRLLKHPAFRPVLILTTFLAVCFGLVFVRSQSFADAGTILAHLVRHTPGWHSIPRCGAPAWLAYWPCSPAISPVPASMSGSSNAGCRRRH